MWARLSGTAQRYVNRDTGETLSRRQYEKLFAPERIASRETRYRVRSTERRAMMKTAAAGRDALRGFWRQRYAERVAIERGVRDSDVYRELDKPGSRFNRLYAEVERGGFRDGSSPDSPYNKLLQATGARAASDDASGDAFGPTGGSEDSAFEAVLWQLLDAGDEVDFE